VIDDRGSKRMTERDPTTIDANEYYLAKDEAGVPEYLARVTPESKLEIWNAPSRSWVPGGPTRTFLAPDKNDVEPVGPSDVPELMDRLFEPFGGVDADTGPSDLGGG
jgi:hypothetical protein